MKFDAFQNYQESKKCTHSNVQCTFCTCMQYQHFAGIKCQCLLFLITLSRKFTLKTLSMSHVFLSGNQLKWKIATFKNLTSPASAPYLRISIFHELTPIRPKWKQGKTLSSLPFPTAHSTNTVPILQNALLLKTVSWSTSVGYYWPVTSQIIWLLFCFHATFAFLFNNYMFVFYFNIFVMNCRGTLKILIFYEHVQVRVHLCPWSCPVDFSIPDHCFDLAFVRVRDH